MLYWACFSISGFMCMFIRVVSVSSGMQGLGYNSLQAREAGCRHAACLLTHEDINRDSGVARGGVRGVDE